jgi:hypothetical protein
MLPLDQELLVEMQLAVVMELYGVVISIVNQLKRQLT